jgi:predicted negative regulator of RcsB-dependent stress response
MSEPTLESIGDYNTLKGEKKRVVWAVIIAGLIIGVMYVVAYNVFDNAQDNINVEHSIKSVPVK